MINLLGEQERWLGVEEMLSEMKDQGLLPNIITYTTLVDVYGRSGRYQEAIDCIEAMKADGLKPSPTMYHALVNAYAQRVRKSYKLFSSYYYQFISEYSLLLSYSLVTNPANRHYITF
jgi:pentatricopeptide repeat protein